MNRLGLSLVGVLVMGTMMPPAYGWTLTLPEVQPSWSLSFQLGPYRPRIAKKGDVRRVFFNQVFRQGLDGSLFDARPLLKQIEVDYYLMNHIGYLGIAIGVGWWQVGGMARVCQRALDCTSVEASDPNLSFPGNTEATLTIMPLTLSVVYRADMPMRQWGIPVMPYVKAGLSYHLWWTRTNGQVATVAIGEEITKGQGGSWGLRGTGGIAINLDWIHTAKQSHNKSAVGLVGSYLFMEATVFYASGFSNQNRLDLSDVVMLLGIKTDFST